MRGFLQSKFEKDFGVKMKSIVPLGGEYWTSPGVTTEQIYPHAIEVSPAGLKESSFLWVKLSDLMENIDLVKDGNLLTSLYRLNHALGVK